MGQFSALVDTATESQVQPDGSTVTSTTDWTYDDLQRLTGEAYASSVSSDDYSDVYTYDLASNRMSSVHTGPGGGADETITYAYNGDDELTSQTSSLSGTTTNSYDPNGSLTSSSTGGVVTATYTYDVRNKMVGYSSGSTAASYVYDDAGNRVKETVNGTATYYLTDTQNPTGYAQPLEAKSSPTAAPSTTYFLGDRVIAQADASGTVTVLLPDGHGSTQQLANSSGSVTAAFQYDAFGTALNFTASGAGTVFLFGGDAVYDPASGTYFHGDGVRQTIGFLFIERDTSAGFAKDPLSLHKYLYANGDPVNNNDPSGHDTLSLVGGVTYGADLYAQDLRSGLLALGAVGSLIAGIAVVEYSELSLANNLGNFSSQSANFALQVATAPLILSTALYSATTITLPAAAAQAMADAWPQGKATRPIVDRKTGKAVGLITDDGTRVVRYPHVDKGTPKPHWNLEDKKTGDNIHVEIQ